MDKQVAVERLQTREEESLKLCFLCDDVFWNGVFQSRSGAELWMRPRPYQAIGALERHHCGGRNT